MKFQLTHKKLLIVMGLTGSLILSSCGSSHAASSSPTACTAINVSNPSTQCTLVHNFALTTTSQAFASDWIVQTETSSSNGALCANNEKELYYNSPDNLSNDSSGDLLITLTAPSGGTNNYHSAKLISNYSIKATTIPHGVVEFTAELPAYTAGAWPALWLYRYADDNNGFGTHTCTSATINGGASVTYANGTWPRDGEIDIMEYIAGSSYSDINDHMFSTLHYGQGWNTTTAPVDVSSPAAQVQHRQIPNFSSLSSGFHNYAAEWNCAGTAPNFTSCTITMYLDGKIMVDENGSPYTFETINGDDTDMDSSFQSGFNNGFNIIMNFATGGNIFGSSTAANGVATGSLPLSMTIRQVAIYQVK